MALVVGANKHNTICIQHMINAHITKVTTIFTCNQLFVNNGSDRISP